MRAYHFGFITAAALGVATVASADPTQMHGIARSGDGITPSYSDYASKYSPTELAPKRSVGSVGAMGNYSMTVPVETPPALVPASIALTYDSSAAKSPSWVAPGWSLSGPPMLTQVSAAERNAEWDGEEQVYRVGGSTLVVDGTLSSIPIGGPFIGSGATFFRATSTSAGETVAAYDDNDDSWWVFDGAILSKFEPALDAATHVTRWRCVWQRDTSMNIAKYEYDVDGRLTWAYAGANQPLTNGEPLEPYPHLIEVEVRYEPRPTDGSEVLRESVVDGVLLEYDQRVDEIVVRARKNVTTNFVEFRRYWPRYGSGSLAAWGDMPSSPGPYLLAIDAEGSASTDGSAPVSRRLHQLEYEEFAAPAKTLTESYYDISFLLRTEIYYHPGGGEEEVEIWETDSRFTYTSEDDQPFDHPLGAGVTMARTWSLRSHWDEFAECAAGGCPPGAIGDFGSGSEQDVAVLGAQSYGYSTSHQLTVAADFNRDGLTDIRFATPDNLFESPNGGTSPHTVKGGERASAIPSPDDPLGPGTLDATIPPFLGPIPEPHDEFDTASLAISASVPYVLPNPDPLDPIHYYSPRATFEVQRRALVDVNGDGSPDLIDSHYDVPIENPNGSTWYGFTAPVPSGPSELVAPSSDTTAGGMWTVHFAQSDGTFSDGVPFVAPVKYPGLKLSPNHCVEMVEQIRSGDLGTYSEEMEFEPDNWFSVAPGARVQLMDLNGDGFVDILEIDKMATTVRYGQAPLASFLAAGGAPEGGPAPSTVQEGWGAPIVLAAPTFNTALQAVLTAPWERHLLTPSSGAWSLFDWYHQVYDDSDPTDGVPPSARDFLPEFYDPSCVVGEVQTSVEFADFNGDGFVDLIQAELGSVPDSKTWSPEQPTDWTVWLGTGRNDGNAFLAPATIDAPTDRGLRVTNEGSQLLGSFGNAGFGGIGLPQVPAFDVEAAQLISLSPASLEPDGSLDFGGGASLPPIYHGWSGYGPQFLGDPNVANLDALAYAEFGMSGATSLMDPGPDPFGSGMTCIPSPLTPIMSFQLTADVPSVFGWTTQDLSGGHSGLTPSVSPNDWTNMGEVVRSDRMHSTSKVVARLMDADQDGLLDFVYSGAHRTYGSDVTELIFTYWKNQGLQLGFTGNQCGGPHLDPSDAVEGCPDLAWLGDGLSGTMSVSGVGASCVGGGGADAADYANGACRTDSRNDRRDLRQVGDFNGDGIVDVIDFADGVFRPGTPQGRGILLRSQSHGGWEESVDYRPAPWGFPNGDAAAWAPIADPDDGRWTRPGWVTRVVRRGDQVSGAFGYDLYSLEDGDCAGGRCRGFATRVHDVCAPVPTLSADQQTLESASIPETIDAFENHGCVSNFILGGTRETFPYSPALWVSPLHTDMLVASPLRRNIQKADLMRIGSLTRSTEVLTHHQAGHLPLYGPFNDLYTDHLVFRAQMGWGEPDGSPCTDESTQCRPLDRFIQRFSADASAPNGGPAPEQMYLSFSYEPLLGLLTEVDENSTDGVDRVRSIDWVINGDATWAVPSGEQLAGEDPATEWSVHEAVVWEYDDFPAGSSQLTRGLMTGQEVCATPRPAAAGSAAGFSCSGETIRWDFGRYTRGPVQSIQGPRGSSSFTEVFRYGGTTPGKVLNALGHTSFTAVDDFGRSWKERDPNEVVSESVYDGWGRISHAYLTGKGGTSPFEVATTTYRDWPSFGGGGTTTPQRMVIQTGHDADDAGASLGSEVVATVLDGAGNTRQEWRKAPPGEAGWIVVNHWHDIFGNEVFTSDPTFVADAGIDPPDDPIAAGSASVIAVSRQFDAFGNERIRRRYPGSRPGCDVRTFMPEPGTTLVEDESGRMALHESDMAGRLLRTAEDMGSGDGSSWDDSSCAPSQWSAVINSGYRPSTTISEYAWDAIDRLSIFRSNAEEALSATGPSLTSHWYDEYIYGYDMAGRLLHVDLYADHGTVDMGAPERWVTYDYEPGEPYPTAKYEGQPTADNEVIRWSYDDLGRLTQRLVRPHDYNPMDWPPTDPATWLTFTNIYDTLPGGAEWLGAQLQASSPWETTTYQFGQAFGPHGTIGHAAGSSRVFADGVLAPRVATSTHSIGGKVLSTSHPTGVVMESEHDDGWLTRQRLITTAGTLVVDLNYDAVGTALGWTAGNKALSLTRGAYLDQLTGAEYDIAGTVTDLSWSYGPDGRITGREAAFVGLPAAPVPDLHAEEDLTYDALSRIAGLDVDRTTSTGGVELAGEAFTYDAIGNVDSFEDRWNHVEWTDYERGFFGLTNYRCGVQDLGSGSLVQLRDEHTYDSQLRLTSRWEWTGVTAGPSGICSNATGGSLVATHTYIYDGSGQLARYQGGSGTNVDFQYSLDGSLVRRVENDGARVEYYAGTWKLDVRDDGVAREVEHVHPAIQVLTESGGTQHLVWLARDITGNAVLQVDNSGEAIHYGRLGAYGAPLEQMIDFAANPASPTPNVSGGLGHLVSFHGVERDVEASLITMGVRHVLATGDGRWLQPEPLLWSRADHALDARSALGAYASASPLDFSDISGFDVAGRILSAFGDLARFLRILPPQTDVVAAEVMTSVTDAAISAGEKQPVAPAKAALKATGPRKVTARAADGPPTGWDVRRLEADAARLRAQDATLPSGACFIAGTEILTASGYRAIEEIETGDVVISSIEHVAGTSGRGALRGREVVATFSRTAEGVGALRVQYADGAIDVLFATGNHPFWVPAVQDYVALEDIEVGTVLRTYGGSEATVLGLTWKPGAVEVYDIEVEGLHNFFVRGLGSDAAGVLVHNSTRRSGVPDAPFEAHPDAGPYKRPSGAGPTAEQRASVQGQPCVDCGATTPRQVADHKDPLVVQHYRDGKVDVDAQRQVEAVQPHCPTCSAQQGGQLGAFGKQMRQQVQERDAGQ